MRETKEQYKAEAADDISNLQSVTALCRNKALELVNTSPVTSNMRVLYFTKA